MTAFEINDETTLFDCVYYKNSNHIAWMRPVVQEIYLIRSIRFLFIKKIYSNKKKLDDMIKRLELIGVGLEGSVFLNRSRVNFYILFIFMDAEISRKIIDLDGWVVNRDDEPTSYPIEIKKTRIYQYHQNIINR